MREKQQKQETCEKKHAACKQVKGFYVLQGTVGNYKKDVSDGERGCTCNKMKRNEHITQHGKDKPKRHQNIEVQALRFGLDCRGKID